MSAILVVDEEEAVRAVLGRALSHEGLAVWQAGSGREALALCQRLRDDRLVAILDVGMSELDGPQTLAALRAVQPSLSCCFMTGGYGKYSEADLLDMGATRVFPKPFNLDDVVRTVKHLASAT
jgi:CheY-like chemotaxis protein